MFAPFVDFHDEPRWCTFWRENLDEVLIQAAVEACVWLSYLNGQLKYSTFKQAWKAAALQGTGTGVSQQARNMEGGFTRIVNVGAGGQMGLLDYTVVITQTLEALREKLRLLGMTMGMGENAFQITTSPESGVAIRLRTDALEERQSQEAITYTRKERSLARIIKFASGTTPAGAGFDPYPENERIDPQADPSKMRVDFSDITKKGMDSEQREYWKWKLEAGLATAAQFLMAENPDLDEEEAQRQADEALADSMRRKAGQTSATIFGTQPATATLTREPGGVTRPPGEAEQDDDEEEAGDDQET
jgi:hypothetical protein